VQEGSDNLLMLALADQLKVPLLQIARLAELPAQGAMDRISIISEQALRLVDGFVLASGQSELTLEPITTSSVLYDVGHLLAPLAKQLDYQLEIDLRGNNKPVMGHYNTLKAMLTLLGASLIEAGVEDETRNIILGTHRSAKGAVVGVFSDCVDMSQRAIYLARNLHGRASQAVPALGASGGAALAVADRLSFKLNAPLKAYRHQSLSGIGSLLVPSTQLQLI
jgi:hypothetical protein